VAQTSRCLPMTVTVQGLSTLSMNLVCQIKPLLSFWTLLPYLYLLVALQSSIGSVYCCLVPFCPCMVFQWCPCVSVLSLLVQLLGSLTTFCRFLSRFRLDVPVESLSVTTSLVFETLNSSSTEESGSFNFVVFPIESNVSETGWNTNRSPEVFAHGTLSTSTAVVGIS